MNQPLPSAPQEDWSLWLAEQRPLTLCGLSHDSDARIQEHVFTFLAEQDSVQKHEPPCCE